MHFINEQSRGRLSHLLTVLIQGGQPRTGEVRKGFISKTDDANFVGLGTSPRYQHMGIGAQVTTTLQVGISETIETGYYSLPIQFSYHHSALGGQTQTATRTIGVNVTGLSPFWDQQDTGAPQLVIEGSQVGLSSAGDGVLLVTLDLTHLQARDGSDQPSSGDGVEAILSVARQTDFALRRLRRRPISLADEFYRMVEA